MGAEHNMARRIQLRRDTAAAWIAANPVLAQGEIGIDLTNSKIKIGNGTTAWNSLAYWDDKETDLTGYATETYVNNAIGAIDIPADVSDLTDTTSLLFDGNYSSLSGSPTIPADVSDLTDTQGLLNNSTGDVTFNGVKVIGAGTASGDGLGYSTLELVPDGTLNTDQYIVVDPTAPNHIHLRAGGTQDASTAALFLGGELNYVRAVDGNGVRLNNAQFVPDTAYFAVTTDYDSATWSTDESGNHWIDIIISDPFNPTRDATPINTAGSRFAQYPTRNSIEVFTGSSLFTVSGNGQAYTLGNPYNYRIGTVEAPPANPTTLESLDYRLNTFNERYLYLENNTLEAYADTVSVFSGQTIDLVTGTGNIRIATDDNDNSYSWYFNSNGTLTFPDGEVQSTAYAGGVGHMMMIDTNRTDSYTEVGSADRPFKTFAAAIAAANAVASAPGAVDNDKRFTFVLMGCVVTEAVDFSGTSFLSITMATTCRSVISGNVTIADIPSLSQMVIRNIEFGGTFNITGDGTASQMNSVSIYNASFGGAVNITATNATAFYEAAFFGLVNFTNVNYIYINGAQFNTDLTFTVDDSGATPTPSGGVTPCVVIGYNFIANNVYMTKVGTGSGFLVFQPHMARMGLSAGTYTIPANFIFQPQGCAIRGTWINNGSTTLRNSSFDVAVQGTAPAYTGVIGGDRVVVDKAPTSSKGAAGDRVGMIAADGNYLYVCVADWTDGLADIWSRTAITAGTW